MNEQNTKKMLTDFPALFRDALRSSSEQQSCMGRGFECGDGWFQLIYELCTSIEVQAREMGLDPATEDWPMARQVKEKFGSMRFYISTPSPEPSDNRLEAESRGDLLSFRPVASIESIRKLVADAEAKSSTICQGCGQPAEMRNDGGYWRVLCDPCEAKRISERNL